ncbi:ribosome-associated translation inhibitor RaiA [Pseudenhygromyxa sp. WMMC2535]|uniref:ribosome hibernation-promoting factor, HPF/YfiA family n=1 Tax=Pseudenhygromyxa sp. WMMC2535 TaxID=2712867 RepID=UPI001555D29D|nr:ribosome-associated translation inhibitor RaiA [Pseudenhygromyxa sp. WMMC2535]NVB36241.1 ribosome-associated translation inhibitor RaiA [Pseudenhygromyxa sp. WMMC2535]NVB43431.1 ribosome-associated translation inhibitor RaiA [Pseudenhygromyxa sp. WMMC2535]
MQTQFVFRHMDSSDALRNYAEERLTKIKRYFSDPLKVNCTFSVEKITHIAQFDVTLRNGLQLHASETTENMYSSIDMALAKMERQVRRYKARITNHKPHKGKTARVRQTVYAPDSFEEPETMVEAEQRRAAEAAEAEAPVVAREKEFRAERLSVKDAVMQLNLMHKQFLVFTNTDTGDINVVYRMEDGGYGLIETRGHVEDA